MLNVRDLQGNSIDLDPNETRITAKRTKRSADTSVFPYFSASLEEGIYRNVNG